jgi:hypothetical protein
MKRLVKIIEYSGIRILIEKYDSANIYPPTELIFDCNLDNILIPDSNTKVSTYFNQYAYGILGRSGIIDEVDPDIYLKHLFNSEIPEYDLSIYELDTEIELEFDGYELIVEPELVDIKSSLIEAIQNSNSIEELVESVETLISPLIPEETEITSLSNPSAIRPRNLDGVTKLFEPFLNSDAYVVNNYVEFIIKSPITDFISNGVDTELMTQIREFYQDWDNIEVEEVVFGSFVVDECIPFTDDKLYMRIGNVYTKVVPSDIHISVSNNYIPLFGNGNTLPKLIVTDGEAIIDLNIDNFRYVDENNVQHALSGLRFRSASLGIVDTELYYKIDEDSYQAVHGLNKTLALWRSHQNSSSGTKFKFYFK